MISKEEYEKITKVISAYKRDMEIAEKVLAEEDPIIDATVRSGMDFSAELKKRFDLRKGYSELKEEYKNYLDENNPKILPYEIKVLKEEKQHALDIIQATDNIPQMTLKNLEDKIGKCELNILEKQKALTKYTQNTQNNG